MNRRHGLLGVALGCAGAMGVARAGEAAMPPAERILVDRLIEAVGQRSDATFIRNGSDYTAEDAATFLRKKLESQGDGLKSAEEFIDRIASKSSMSGESYRVKLSDGREMSSAQFLRAELQRLKRR
jgi:hypothetical protein